MPANILRVALPTPLRRYFDYLVPQDFDCKELIPGVRVQVPFQRRTLVGILIEAVDQTAIPKEKLKFAMGVLDQTPLLPPDIFKICEWAADYYHYSLGDVLMSALPIHLRKGKPIPEKLSIPIKHIEIPILPTLNPAQENAVNAINKAVGFNVFLLDGVTGSGKTEVYLRVISEMLAQNKQILVLVPEISLTPQTITQFESRFSVSIVALHSSLSNKKRVEAWLATKMNQAKIVIGTRSAIFTPFENLGLIIVDEEHDTSFKQQDRFRYHARDLAIMRARENKISIILGSATPSLESLLNAKRNRYHYLSLPERAGAAQLPAYQLVDMRGQSSADGLSPTLIDAIKNELAKQNQVLLFLNKRGFAPVMYCIQCQTAIECKRCDARMVYHQTTKRLHCHHCDTRIIANLTCKECGGNLQAVGLGTQRLQQTLANTFPSVPLIRIDSDTTRKKNTLQGLLKQINEARGAILLGTQILAKGHHFQDVTLVGIVDADSGLFSADFRASEQMGQLLLQVAGRAGRADKPGKVIIQTAHPTHPLLTLLIEKGYHVFATKLLAEREQCSLPPYAYFAMLRAEAYREEKAIHFLQWLKEDKAFSASLLGPIPAVLAKRKGLYCHHLLIKAAKRSELNNLIKKIILKIEKLPSKNLVKWTLDVDPIEVI